MKFKTRILTTAIALCLVVSSWSQAATRLSARSQLQQLLNAYHSYQASYRQLSYNAQGRVVARNHGKIFVLRPGKFRWQSNSPTAQTLIANGQLLWVYDIDLQQATQRKLTRQDDSLAALMTGDADKVLVSYQVQYLKNKSPGTWFRLLPKVAGKSSASAMNQGLFQSLDLQFVQQRLQALRMLNHLDEYTSIQFYKIKLNQRLKASLFQFTPPPGVDVLKQ